MSSHTSITYRNAVPGDVESMRTLILEHGPNPWNHLPEEGVSAHLERIRRGREWAVTAWAGKHLAGFVSFRVGCVFPQYEAESSRNCDHGYIVEGVVHRDHAGSGIGTRLIEMAKERLRDLGVPVVYADRHEENRASAALMRSTGFVIVDTYPEPERRPHGSGRTSVGRCPLTPDAGLDA